MQNKNNRQFIILVGLIAGLLLFQNCAKQMFSQCTTDCEEWRSVVEATKESEEFQKISFYDEKQFEILSNSKELLVYSSKGIEHKPSVNKFFGNEFAAVVQIPADFQGMVFSIHSENVEPDVSRVAEAARVIVEGDSILIEHTGTATDVYRIKYSYPKTGKDLVLGVYFGLRVLDIRIVVNGKLISSDDTAITTNLEGAPSNYSYIEKNLWVNTTLAEILVFNRKLSTYELASASRHIANMNALNYVVYDESIKVDSDVNFIQERQQFIAARDILKANSCFKCHGSWVTFGEYNYISEGLIKENSAANSPLWTRLAGTLEPNKLGKKKDMPLKQNQLKNEELDILKAWIMSFTSE